MTGDDWSFCRRALVQHSRTFALPIALLPDTLERGVTSAYLLCRIADTVEDTEAWTPRTKEHLFRSLLDVLSEQNDAEAFVAASRALHTPDNAEHELLCGLPKVLRVFRDSPGHVDARRWISELVRGMALYAQRPSGHDGIQALNSMADLDRYCYFVAGTVGEMLTDLFACHLALPEPSQIRLHEHAEAFGRGLQLVNVLRDLSGDLERGVCYVPRAELHRHGLQPRALTRAECAGQVREALVPMFTLAQQSLKQGLEYVLRLPANAAEIRGFCLVPLWLAVATLRECQRDPRLLQTGQRVKLSRPEVAALIRDCSQCATDDRALRKAFSELQSRESVVVA